MKKRWGCLGGIMMKIFVGAHSLSCVPKIYRHQIGNLFSPGCHWNSGLQFALDNGVYRSWKKNQDWSATIFKKLLDKVSKLNQMPLWVVVPDVVGNHKLTLEKWREWQPMIIDRGFACAFAVQDGCTPEDVPVNADVVFIGGTTAWKHRNIKVFCDNFPRVHVARVNTYTWLWHSYQCGAESIDGTGWFWTRKREHQDLLDFLAITNGHQDKETGALFRLSDYLSISV
jgi:hypothetical protein